MDTSNKLALCFLYSRDGLDHVDAHLHAAVGVVSPRFRQSRHTIITIAQNFNTQTVVFLGKGEETVIKQKGVWGEKQWRFDQSGCKINLPPSKEHSKKCKATGERTPRDLLTDASLSKRAKSSLSVMTSSWAVHWEARLVKPSMSANRILRQTQREIALICGLPHWF